MSPITSYADVINTVAKTISQLTLKQQRKFIQYLLHQFVQDLPDGWLDGELAIEQPHYQAIAEQLIQQSWNDAMIGQQLNALDDIMFGMGDAYPHQTSEAILLLLDMLGFYLSLAETEEKSEVSNDWVMLSAHSYLDYYDNMMEQNSEQSGDAASSFDHWLAHPITETAFQNVNNALDFAKHN